RLESGPQSMTEVSIIVATDNLASALRDQGKYGEAEALNRRALAATDSTTHFGLFREPASVIYTRNLGRTLMLEAQYTEAEALLPDALTRLDRVRRDARTRSAFDRLPGSDATTSLAIDEDLGVLLIQEGRYADGEALLRNVVAISGQNLGPNHPQTLLATS